MHMERARKHTTKGVHHIEGFDFGTERRRMKLTQYDLASMAGVHQGRIGDFERGRRQLDPSEMKALTRTLKEYKARWAKVTELLDVEV